MCSASIHFVFIIFNDKGDIPTVKSVKWIQLIASKLTILSLLVLYLNVLDLAA